MFLGTHRVWWIAAGLFFAAGLFLIGSDTGGTLGKAGGFLLLFASMGIFGMSPRRSNRSAGTPAVESLDSDAPPPVAAMPAPPPRPRATIEARDASDV